MAWKVELSMVWNEVGLVSLAERVDDICFCCANELDLYEFND